MKSKHLFIALALGLGLTFALLWLMGASPGSGLPIAHAQSGTGVIRVATVVADTPGCGSVASPCRTVQYAVDRADVGDEVHVAAGLYTDIYTRNVSGDVVTQTIFIAKSLSIQGGYTTSNWITPDPIANPTILDAQGLGRVIYISREVTVTLDGLHIVNGAGDRGGGGSPVGSGGGIMPTAAPSQSPTAPS